jgi:hypothetical protein
MFKTYFFHYAIQGRNIIGAPITINGNYTSCSDELSLRYIEFAKTEILREVLKQNPDFVPIGSVVITFVTPLDQPQKKQE